jgi:hypothetical protein
MRLRRFGASTQKEDTVKLITRFELTSRTTSEILSLHASFISALGSCGPHSADQRTCLASLKALEDELDARSFCR